MNAILRDLDARRRRLRMSKRDVAERARVSLPTINRVFSNRPGRPSGETLEAIADALGVVVRLGGGSAVEERQSASEYCRQQAADKAARLVRMVQGTMAIESQAVRPKHVAQLEKLAQAELLKSPRKLWGK